jgi:Patatin-like phospholipase
LDIAPLSETPVTSSASADRNPSRDRHLFSPGPKRLLALDGGGVRGAITVAFLERIEKLLADEEKRRKRAASDSAQASAASGEDGEEKFRLGDWFDLVGGTSTGAVIAGALALGHTTAEIKDFYIRLAPRAFTRQFWRIPGLQAKFDASALRQEIDSIVKDRRLDSPDLITGLCVVTKRLDTGSPWILANNPRAPYWNSAASDPTKNTTGHTGNRYYRLSNLVRASTAAPHFFDPEVIAISEDERKQPLADLNAKLAGHPWLSLIVSKIRARLIMHRGADSDARIRKEEQRTEEKDKSKGIEDTHGLFVDGGVTPYNNPTMALLMMTQLDGFGLKWPLGPEHLSIVSIGTGSHRTKLSFKDLRWFGPLKVTLHALLSMMGDAETLALAQMQWLGQCPQPWEINSEIRDLAKDAPPGGKWFRFLRYDVRLEVPWLATNLEQKFSDREVERFRKMDDPGIIKAIYDLAEAAAKKQVKLEHLIPNAPTKPQAAPL